MAWSIHHDLDSCILEIRYTGENSMDDLKESTSRAIAETKEHDITRIIVDVTEVKLPFETSELIQLPGGQYVLEHARRDSYVAVVMPNSHRERNMARFYENACRNRGWHVKTFAGRESALQWLEQVAPLKTVNS